MFNRPGKKIYSGKELTSKGKIKAQCTYKGKEQDLGVLHCGNTRYTCAWIKSLCEPGLDKVSPWKK